MIHRLFAFCKIKSTVYPAHKCESATFSKTIVLVGETNKTANIGFLYASKNSSPKLERIQCFTLFLRKTKRVEILTFFLPEGFCPVITISGSTSIVFECLLDRVILSPVDRQLKLTKEKFNKKTGKFS